MATVYEWCPNCDYENEFENWDVKRDGYVATCKNCGRELMLCDMCMHTDENGNECECHVDCHWTNDGTRCYRKGFNTRKENKTMRNFYDVCESVKARFFEDWNCGSTCASDIRKNALSFKDKETNFLKERINSIMNKMGYAVDEATMPSWYMNMPLIDAIYAETFGWGVISEWFTDAYADSECFIISGENCFIIRNGHQKLMKQRVSGSFVQGILNLFDLDKEMAIDIDDDTKLSVTCNNSLVFTRPTPCTVTKQDITLELWSRMTDTCVGAAFDDNTIKTFKMRKTNSFSIELKDGREFKVIVKDLREED